MSGAAGTRSGLSLRIAVNMRSLEVIYITIPHWFRDRRALGCSVAQYFLRNCQESFYTAKCIHH